MTEYATRSVIAPIYIILHPFLRRRERQTPPHDHFGRLRLPFSRSVKILHRGRILPSGSAVSVFAHTPGRARDGGKFTSGEKNRLADTSRQTPSCNRFSVSVRRAVTTINRRSRWVLTLIAARCALSSVTAGTALSGAGRVRISHRSRPQPSARAAEK